MLRIAALFSLATSVDALASLGVRSSGPASSIRVERGFGRGSLPVPQQNVMATASLFQQKPRGRHLTELNAVFSSTQSLWQERQRGRRMMELKAVATSTQLERATNLFPVWVCLASVLGWFKPCLFEWFMPLVTPALAATMLSMGMTLTLEDFKRVAATPKWVGVGFLSQFTIMPLTAAFMARLFGLNADLASGLILVGCAPGGTASNLVALISKADVALSVLMTMASTIAAIVLTPLLTAKLAGGYVEVKAAELVLSTLSVVLLPVLSGIALNTAVPKLTKKVASVTPFLSVLLVAAICGSISAANSGTALASIGLKLLGAVVGLHSVGFALGYFISDKLGAGEARSRTIAIEVGMQNSALACVLSKHFPNPVLSSLPGALSATVHSVIGSILAAFWRQKSLPSKKTYGISKRYW